MNSTLQSNDKLSLRNIYGLLGEAFFIPAYQRGYRWTSIQVQELLSDIWEFTKSSSDNKSAFYCLQPVVVVRDGDRWQVVDGQQRLTTLYLILHYLEQEHLRRPLSDAFKKSLYSLKYETRPKCEDFLLRIHGETDTSNIDYFHMVQAYKAISDWFADKNFNHNNDLLKVLLEESPTERAVKVIWYDLSDECINNEYAIDVFSRINIGKIPLTNAELIKALFLKQSHFEQGQASSKQLQIATEWDAIEKRLQEPAFWYFINDSSKHYPTRIEYIFDLMKGKQSGNETFFTFHQFHADFKSGKADIGSLWKDIKEFFLTFDEWFQDRELYHLIGFLVDSGEKVVSLKSESQRQGSTKTIFKRYLKNRIRERTNCKLDELQYGDSKIKRILLLFNIQTLLSTQEADMRFPFDRYKREQWDIEHIRSQTDTVPTGTSRNEWLEDVRSYFSGMRFADALNDKEKGFLNRINALQPQPSESDDFQNLYTEVIKYFKQEDVSWVDDLGNLALLDAATNRSYKNALFPIKRARIIENDRCGIFVPICTKNVFLKYYSQTATELIHWTESDAYDYKMVIGEVLKEYLSSQGERDE